MFNLPDSYIQRSERVLKSSKPNPDYEERPYLDGLLEALQDDGFEVFISGLESFLPLLPKIGRSCNFIDYGYQIEIASKFSSSLLKVNFDELRSSSLKSLALTRSRKRAFLIVDILGETKDPTKILESYFSILAEDDCIIVILPDRSSQPSNNSLGPPSYEHRMREWESKELTCFIETFYETNTTQTELIAQHLKNTRKDIIVYPKSICKALTWCLHNFKSEVLTSFEIQNHEFEKSTFSFDIEFAGYDGQVKHGLLNYPLLDTIEEKILYNIANEIPSSLVRVGHAEIRLLGVPDFIHPVWASRSLNVCFGEHVVSEGYERLRLDMLESFKKADFVGVPKMQEHDQHWKNAIPLLSYYGCDLAKMVLHSQNIHLQMLTGGFYDRLLRSVDEVLLIGCRDIREKLKNKYSISEVSWIETPGEAKFVDIKAQHYPDVYDQIKNELPNKIRKLVLVGAGLPGNSYCNWAKELGATAIDIGSVMDIWGNEETRTSFSKYSKYSL